MLHAVRAPRGLDTDGLQPTRRLYLNERLTEHNPLLFVWAHELDREMKYKFLWTRDGKIYVHWDPGMVKQLCPTSVRSAQGFC